MCNVTDYAIASLLLDSGGLATVPLSVQLLEWLFSTGSILFFLFIVDY